MSNIYENYVINYDLQNTLFGKFCKNASCEEFVKSQKGFYFAVQAFPQMLCLLASKIKNPDVRFKLVENIWEEHGKGDINKFHTVTFKEYLTILGDNNITPNFFIEEWIKKILANSDFPENYSAYLAGIEFIYTKISHLICETLDGFELNNNQHHYKTHKILDFTHAMDLLDVSFLLIEEKNISLNKIEYSNFIFEDFVHGVEDLVDLFNQLSFLTEKEIKNISQDKIAFYYSREDSQIELKYSNNNNRNRNILIVGSGGEHIINLKNRFPNAKITALDINASQLKLTQDKLQACNQVNDNIIFHANSGKFEALFNYLSKKLSSDDVINIKNNNVFALKKLDLICQDIFSNKNLNIVFTEDATKYSSENFANHFYQVFIKKIKELDSKSSNMNSILNRTLPMDYPKNINIKEINYYCGDFFSYFNEKTKNKYDMISISNVGDWMPTNQLQNLLDKANQHLMPNGVLIARKLLGDYSLKELMLNQFSKIIEENDNTGFYNECYVGFKNEY